MEEQVLALGQQSPEQIAKKLREMHYKEAAQIYEIQAKKQRAKIRQAGTQGTEFMTTMNYTDILPQDISASSQNQPPCPWLNSQHEFGFIAPFTPGSDRYHPIVSASNMQPEISLKNERINIRLDFLRVYDYPKPFFDFGDNVHTIHFQFEALNQVTDSQQPEPVAFNQTYLARSGQDVAVTGYPIFIGLTVGANGVGFSCKTVNVGNSDDEKVVTAISSDTVNSGLNLLTTAQPVLTPFISIVKGLTTSLASQSQNVLVQSFELGLDFDPGSTGASLAEGSYLVVQTSQPGEIVWNDWKYDAETGTVVRAIAVNSNGTPLTVLPYNAIIFRIGKYQS